LIEIKNYYCYFNEKYSLTINNLLIPERGCFIITGDNGSGKTTLVRSILNIYQNYTGEIYIDDKLNKDYTRKQIASIISYLPQTSNMEIEIYVSDFIKQGLYVSKISFYNDVIKILNLERFLEKRFDKLSGGEKQLIRIARSMVANTKYTFLDEPDSFLSKKNRERFFNLVDYFNNIRSIIIISHGELTNHNIKNILHLEINND